MLKITLSKQKLIKNIKNSNITPTYVSTSNLLFVTSNKKNSSVHAKRDKRHFIIETSPNTKPKGKKRGDIAH